MQTFKHVYNNAHTNEKKENHMNPEFRAIESQPDPECPCCECGKESDAHGELEDGSFICIGCEIKDLQNYVDEIEGLMARDQKSMDVFSESWHSTRAEIARLKMVIRGHPAILRSLR